MQTGPLVHCLVQKILSCLRKYIHFLSKITELCLISGAYFSVFMFINTWEGFKELEAFHIYFEIQQPQEILESKSQTLEPSHTSVP